MKWRNSLSVGNVEFDNELKEMITQINKKINALTASRGHLSGDTDFLMNSLRKIFEDNFQKQEETMLLLDFESYTQHKFQHDRFLKEFDVLKDLLMADEFSVGANVVHINSKISQWLVLHITTLDKEFGSFYNLHKDKKSF